MYLNTEYTSLVIEEKLNLVDISFSLGIWFFALLYYLVVAIEIYLFLTHEKNIVYDWYTKVKHEGVFSLFKDYRFVLFFIFSLFLLFLIVTHLEWFMMFFDHFKTPEPSEADLLYRIHNN